MKITAEMLVEALEASATNQSAYLDETTITDTVIDGRYDLQLAAELIAKAATKID